MYQGQYVSRQVFNQEIIESKQIGHLSNKSASFKLYLCGYFFCKDYVESSPPPSTHTLKIENDLGCIIH